MSPNATIKLSPTKFVVAPANMAVDVTKKATKATLNATTTVASGALSATTFAGSGALKQVRHQGRTRVIQRRFNVSVPRARVSEKASMLRERSER